MGIDWDNESDGCEKNVPLSNRPPIFFSYMAITTVLYISLAQFLPENILEIDWANSLTATVGEYIPQVGWAYEYWENGHAIGVMPFFYAIFWLYSFSLTPIIAFWGRRENLRPMFYLKYEDDPRFGLAIALFVVVPAVVIWAYYFKWDHQSNYYGPSFTWAYLTRGFPLVCICVSSLLYIFFANLFDRFRFVRGRREIED